MAFEETLAQTLVTVAPHAGLAALSLTLRSLWLRRDEDVISLASYHNGPLMPAVIAATGDAAIASLSSDPARQAAGRILANLAARTSESVLVARCVPTQELLDAAGPAGRQALAALVDHQLVTITGDTAQVAHEELLVSWPRLRGWLDEESAQRAMRSHLSRAASVWAASGARAEDLYQGVRLAAAVEFASANAAYLSAVEREFPPRASEWQGPLKDSGAGS